MSQRPIDQSMRAAHRGDRHERGIPAPCSRRSLCLRADRTAGAVLGIDQVARRRPTTGARRTRVRPGPRRRHLPLETATHTTWRAWRQPGRAASDDAAAGGVQRRSGGAVDHAFQCIGPGFAWSGWPARADSPDPTADRIAKDSDPLMDPRIKDSDPLMLTPCGPQLLAPEMAAPSPSRSPHPARIHSPSTHARTSPTARRTIIPSSGVALPNPARGVRIHARNSRRDSV